MHTTDDSRYKHTVETRGDMLIVNICLYREKFTPCYIGGGATRGMHIMNICLYRVIFFFFFFTNSLLVCNPVGGL